MLGTGRVLCGLPGRPSNWVILRFVGGAAGGPRGQPGWDDAGFFSMVLKWCNEWVPSMVFETGPVDARMCLHVIDYRHRGHADKLPKIRIALFSSSTVRDKNLLIF